MKCKQPVTIFVNTAVFTPQSGAVKVSPHFGTLPIVRYVLEAWYISFTISADWKTKSSTHCRMEVAQQTTVYPHSSTCSSLHSNLLYRHPAKRSVSSLVITRRSLPIEKSLSVRMSVFAGVERRTPAEPAPVLHRAVVVPARLRIWWRIFLSRFVASQS